ncbi:hypothetical protein F4777DRAFT_348034 [Nemania sp. FL0916]|nr:hypothetical protein F4777DRAFT_348034 [Nemania sp. FL0916]
MAVSSTSPCYQAARRHLRPHYDSIWVSDGLLSTAFERYVSTFRTRARCASSVPGPMEHRKRLAKRQMGELRLGPSPSAAPIWELASLVDLTQWKWKPPTPPDARCRQSTATTTTEPRTLSDAVLRPLQLLFTARANTPDDFQKAGETLLPRNVTLSGVAEQLPPAPWDPDSSPADIIRIALDSFSQDGSGGTGTTWFFSSFCDKWRRALAEKAFRGEAIGTVLTGIVDGLDAECSGARDSMGVERLKLLLVEATIDGLFTGSDQESTSFDHDAWNSILLVVSIIRMNTLRIFTKAVSCIPKVHLKSVSSGILANLDTFLHALGRSTKPPSLARQTAKMAVPLQSLGEPELRFILDDATRKVSEYARVNDTNYSHVRLGWLLLLARLPGVDDKYLAQVCNSLEADLATQPLTHSEVCQVFLVWNNVQAPLERYVNLRKVSKYNSTKCYNLLSDRLWETRQFSRVRQFYTFLRAIGRESVVTLMAKAISLPQQKAPYPLVNIALGMRKPGAAIDILCLYEDSRKCRTSFWSSSFGFKALEILTWVPDFDHKRLWRMLKFVPGRRFTVGGRRRRLKGLNQDEIIKLSAIAIVTSLSPHLTERTAFSLLMNCSLNLRRHNTKLPRHFLRILIHNVTRQLVNGQPGIKSRLWYVLYLIEQQLGRAEALRIESAMQRRREFNTRIR